MTLGPKNVGETAGKVNISPSVQNSVMIVVPLEMENEDIKEREGE